MMLRAVLASVFGTAILAAVSGQAPSPAPVQRSAVTYTAYAKNTELFAEWRPLIVEEAARRTAHLTRRGADSMPHP